MSIPRLSRPGYLSLAVLAAAGAGGVAMSWFVAGHSLLGARWDFIGLLAAWCPLWLVAAWAAQRLPTPWALGAVLLISILLRLAAATGTTPSISSDVYRYAWDAHVQLSGVDPYRYPPDAPALAGLRTPGYWPDPATCARLSMAPGCSRLNRPDVRTIYPAVGEAWFVFIHLFNPGDSGSRPWQIAGGLVDDATIVALAWALRQHGRDPRQVAWYALSPLPVVEFAGNGHVDGFALLLMVTALIALRRERRVLAGVLFGLATMVKLYPGLGVIAGARRGRWRFIVAAAVTAVVTELPHVMAVGVHVVGYLPGYLREEHYTTGGRFLLLDLLHLPATLEVALAVTCMLVAMVAVARSHLDPATGLAVLLGVLMFVATPVQPWYAVAAAGIGVLAGAPWLLLVAAVAEPYYAAVILDDPHQVGAGRLAYGVGAVAVAAALVYARRRARVLASPVPVGQARG
ncbi:MAG: glycosyltransferase 87 family protein [Acidimicrobiales bacterium]